MSDGFELLVEKDEMWARMLIQVLEDHEIPCAAQPVYGAGFVTQTGMQERLQIYVPADRLQQASELLGQLFSGEGDQE